ncbi:hypothetical protein B0A50_08695 [Salinomyces thailandicus]|uniref:Protein phosphatase methylesterase 1 n=1 Tax=Salinomyces thailandicus TaxID=706561 RepID=A0A4U0TIZ5_9PEZI|nr:hypothetical protein B0A50_08695 [Salinomyces thailandica]
MSDLLRQSVDNHLPPPPPPAQPHARPRPDPIPSPNTIPELDEHSSSPSSDSSDLSASSADSATSINTVRPSSHEQAASPNHWTTYFAQELYLDHVDNAKGFKACYHVYLTPPSDPQKDPLFICHHGAGATGLSFAVFAQELHKLLPTAGILSLEARAHGSTIHPTAPQNDDDDEPLDFSLPTLSADALTMINLTATTQNWPTLPPTLLLGHSLGAAILTDLASTAALGAQLLGLINLDIVEGSAVSALAHMQTHLASRPSTFPSIDAAITWHLRTRTLRNPASAAISVPSLLKPSDPSTPSEEKSYTWLTPLPPTAPFWPTWFTSLSSKFLSARAAKLLILAGTDRLDRELMIAQMQGKFQLVVLPEAGHFVQEDEPERVAEVVVGFWRRNDRGALVLPPKVGDLIRMGKKV